MKDMRSDEMRTETDMRTDENVRTDDMRTEKEMRDERRTAERRQRESDDAMRSNPEVMGRAEPQPVGRVGGPGEVRATNGAADMWPVMTEFHSRFDQIQAEFIDDPKSAVTKAEKLMSEMLDHMMSSMRDRMKTMHRDVESNTDTEHLRLVMRKFREFIDSFGQRQAA